jgi:TonB family protein
MRRHTEKELRKLLIFFLIGISGMTSVSAEKAISERSDSTALRDGISMKTVVYQVPPAYPYEARRSGITGHGILFGRVDFKTGNVTSVTMEKSTGNTLLDQAALNAFRQWRFKPGTIRQFRTPITYEMSRNREEAMEKIRRLKAAEAQQRATESKK